MVDAHVVQLITQYLDQCAAKNEVATLVGIHWYVDGRHKAMPSTEEVNEALKQRPATYAQRGPNGVVFTSTGTESTVNVEDMRLADRRYRNEFATTLKMMDR